MATETEVWASQLRKGLLELAVLGILKRKPHYSAELVAALADHPSLAISPGTVYPLLARLAKSQLVATTWQESPHGPPRKYYRLTDSGRSQLKAMSTEFSKVTTAMTSILGGTR